MKMYARPLLKALGLLLFMAGCSPSFTVLQPINSSVQQTTQSGISMRVFPFSPEALPKEILEQLTPVFVYAENQSDTPIRLTPASFSLSIPGKGTVTPAYIPPFQQTKAPLAISEPVAAAPAEPKTDPTPSAAMTNVALPPEQTSSENLVPSNQASTSEDTNRRYLVKPQLQNYRMVIRSAPAYGSVRSYGGGHVARSWSTGRYGSYRPYQPRAYGYGSYRRPYSYRYPAYRPYGYYDGYVSGLGWPYYSSFGIYAPWYTAYGWPYSDYVAYQQGDFIDEMDHAEEILERKSLPAMNLGKNEQASGFIYFPKMDLPAGTQVILTWHIQDAQGKTIGEISTPVVINETDG